MSLPLSKLFIRLKEKSSVKTGKTLFTSESLFMNFEKVQRDNSVIIKNTLVQNEKVYVRNAESQ